MQVSPVREVKKSRKKYRCYWCWEWITEGSSYYSWFTFVEAVAVKMHPECYKDMLKVNKYVDELPPPGTYHRGCHCGDKVEYLQG
jgi:hypothetical protein